MTELFYVFLANFFFVGLKAAQQLNVVRFKWLWIPPVSYAMTFTQYSVWGMILMEMVAEQSLLAGLPMILAAGTSAWMGTYLAMYLHWTKPDPVLNIAKIRADTYALRDELAPHQSEPALSNTITIANLLLNTIDLLGGKR